MLTCKQHMFPRHALQQIRLQDSVNLEIVRADDSPGERVEESLQPELRQLMEPGSFMWETLTICIGYLAERASIGGK